MRHVRFGCAMSLDGYIAGPQGEYDWIPRDPEIDFAGLMQQFDTFLIGRRTYEMIRRAGDAAPVLSGVENIVFSRTLNPKHCPGLRVERDAEPVVRLLREAPGKDIALFGGGE